MAHTPVQPGPSGEMPATQSLPTLQLLKGIHDSQTLRSQPQNSMCSWMRWRIREAGLSLLHTVQE